MLNDNLAATLIRKQILVPNTRVLVEDEVNSFAGSSVRETEFFVNRIRKESNGEYVFELIDVNKSKQKIVTSNRILTIDGMNPAQLAAAYDIRDNGDKKVLGKRRGRPRKYFRPELKINIIKV